MRFTRDSRAGRTRWAAIPVVLSALVATGCFGEGTTESGGGAILGEDGRGDARPEGERGGRGHDGCGGDPDAREPRPDGRGDADCRERERPPEPCEEPHGPPPCAEEVEHCFGHAETPEEQEGCHHFERECFGEPDRPPPPCAEEVERCFGHAETPEEQEGCHHFERECFGERHDPPPCENEVERCHRDADSPERSAECEAFAQECFEGR